MMILDWILMAIYKLHQPTTLQPINLHKGLFPDVRFFMFFKNRIPLRGHSR
jgi:hypothetical protein